VKSVRSFLETIRVEHTVFALPFAYMTLFLAARGWPSWHDFLWITIAMVTGRTVGMGLNRIIDAEIDARNPRTASRAIPAGRLSIPKALAFTIAAGTIFIFAVFQLHPICRWLWPLPVLAMTVYPYAKRFTPFAHLFLGLVYVMIPTAVWLAITGSVPPIALALGLGAGMWVVGFDIIYACQDAETDRQEGLHSIPADFGVARALGIAKWLHVGFLVALLAASRMFDAGQWYYVAVTVTAIALLYEHRLVSPGDLSKVNAAFFTTNGIVSVALFALIALDTVI
jgi:4-hydroxybenzoate polyprenyltransferase